MADAYEPSSFASGVRANNQAGTKGVDVIRAKDKPITTIFKTMAAKLDQDNPQQFRLPQEIRQYFNGVGTGAKGEYLDTESARNKYEWVHCCL